MNKVLDIRFLLLIVGCLTGLHGLNGCSKPAEQMPLGPDGSIFEEPTPEELRDPAASLSSISVFAFGGVGYTGTTSRGELLFRAICGRKERVELFKQIYRKGSVEARAYALAGLFSFDRETFEQLSSTIKEDAEVRMMAGCIFFTLPVTDVIKQIGEGEYTVFIENYSTD